MHPTVKKALEIGQLAKRHGWRGTINSEALAGQRITSLSAGRNDERIFIYWEGERLSKATYSIFDSIPIPIDSQRKLLEKITEWPSVVGLFNSFPNLSRASLIESYRRLPFLLDDDEDTIIGSILGRRIWWYHHEASKIELEVVKPKRDKRFRIVDITSQGRLLHFIGVTAGFRSVFVDSIIEVGND